MINIEITKNGTAYNVYLKGRLDTTTAPKLAADLQTCYADATELTFDLKDLNYISSAGLRVILQAQKTMNRHGKMILRNVGTDIYEVFEVTGFIDMLTIE